MSTTIDERVVEMRFDNEQFKAGARETMESLSKLRSALDKAGTTRAFENIDKSAQNVHLEGIAAGVEALQKRFSVFGIVGIKAINGVANSLVGMFKKLYNATLGQVISGGIKRAMNMENARFQLQALFAKEKNAAELVEQVMKDANKAVDGTAYSLDAAAKAASQFAATGIKAGDEMQGALRGIVGVAAMTNSDFESISDIFTTVAGQGRVMGDQLNQLASRGLNAAATMATFASGVASGSIKASDEVTALVKSFGKGSKITEGDIRKLVSQGKISFKMFSEAMTDAFADSAEKANETFTGALSNVKSALSRIGAGFISPLIAQNSKIVELFNALRLKINEFKKAIVFDEEYGNVMAVSKQFTDMVLKMAEALTGFINKIDTAAVMRDFYYGLETVKNVFKSLWVIVKPALMALSGLIKPIGDAIHTILVILEAVTSRMIASESVSSALGEVLKEIVSIVGTLISGFLTLIQSVFKPFNKETKNVNSGLASFLKSIASVLRGFNEWVNNSSAVNKSFKLLSVVLKTVIGYTSILGKLAGGILAKGLAWIVKNLQVFINTVKESGIISDILSKVSNAFERLFNTISSFKIPGPIKNFKVIAKGYSESGEEISSATTTMVDRFKSLNGLNKNISVVSGTLGIMTKNLLGSGKTIGTFIKDFATVDTLRNILDKFVETGKKFLTFVKEFGNTIIASAVGGGITYALVKIGKSIGSVSNVMNNFGKIFANLATTVTQVGDGLAGTLRQTQKAIKAYQRDLNANALIKVAAAIAILSGTLVILSRIDSTRLLSAATALTMVSVVILGGVTVLDKALNKTKNVYDVLSTLSNDIGKAIKTKAIGSSLKNLGQSLLMISGSIIAIALMYRKDSAALNESLKIVAAIGLVISGFMITMTAIGKYMSGGMKSMTIALFGVSALVSSLLMVTLALNKLFKMKLPMDYKQKLGILYGILGSLTAITAALTLLSGIGHGGKLTTMPIFLLFTSLHAIISAMQRLFKLSLPHDYKKKLDILNGMLAALTMVVLTMSVAARIAGGSLKAGGTILAISGFLVTAVGMLAVLTVLPLDKIKNSAIVLGSVMLSLGAALMLASTVTSKETSRAILAMAASIGAFTAALAILTILDPKKLLFGTAALSAALLAMGEVVKQAGSVTSGKDAVFGVVAAIVASIALAAELYILSNQDWKGILASGIAMGYALKAYAEAFETLGDANNINFKMVAKFIAATVAAIPLAASLYIIADKPWSGMLASGIAMAQVIKAYGVAFEVLGNAGAIDIKQVKSFLLASLAVIPLASALGVLAFQPWGGILAAGASISATMIAYSKAFEILSKAAAVDLAKVKSFLLASLAVIPLASALGVLAFQPWDQLLGAAASLSVTLIAFTACFAVISKTVTPDPKLSGMFVAASVALIPIAIALKIIADEPWDQLLGAAASLSLVLVALAGTMDLCIIAGKFAKEAAIGVGLLSAFVVAWIALAGVIGWVVDELGAGDAIIRGIEIIQQVGEGLGTAIGKFVGGIAEGATSGLSSTADNLSAFMEHLQPFIDGLEYINEDSIKGVMMLGDMVTSLAGAEVLQSIGALLGGEANFEALGSQLNALAPFLQTFSESVSGISPESVAGAKTASDIMLALSDSLPRVGGVMDSILGKKKTLAEFGAELAAFGPPIKIFSQIVSGIEPSSVEGAAAAANIMAEVGNNLPPADGLIQKIFGQKTLAEFGAELVPFGLHIKMFAGIVKGLDVSAVEAAANAGGIMSRLAETLPNSGGVIEWFTGSNDIDDFGEKLVTFGRCMVSFTAMVSGMDESSVTGIATITSIMSELAGALPNTESVFAVFTGGQMDFKKFGNQLEKFGKSLAKYSDSVAGVDLGMIESATTAISNIVALLNSMIGIDPNAMSNFSLALGNTSGITIQEFVAGFQNGDVLVIAAIAQLFSNITQSINANVLMLIQILKTNVNAMALALGMYLPLAFANIKATMINIGHMIGDGLAIGISEGVSKVRQATLDMANVVADTTKNALQINSPSKLASMLGGWWNQGLASGLMSNIGVVRNASLKIAKDGVENPIRNGLKIHSPSQVGEYLGSMVPEGIANGVKNTTSKVTDAVTNLTDKTKDIMGDSASKIGEFVDTKVKDTFGDSVYEVYGGVKKLITNGNEEITDSVEKGGEAAVNAGKSSKSKGLKQESNYWSELLRIKQAGVDGAKYKDMDLKKFQESILAETTDLFKNYTEQLQSTTKSVYDSVSPFEALEKKETISKDKLKQNLEGQVNAYQEYAELLQTINLRTGDSNLGDYLRTLGVDSLDQLKVINSMTDEELTNYANLFDTKYAYAQNIASSQLYDLQRETESKLADMFGGMADAVNLFDFAEVFNGSFESIDQYVSGVMIPIQEANIKAKEEATLLGENVVDGVNMGMADGAFDEVVNTHMDAAFENARAIQLGNAESFGEEIGTYINKGAAKGMGTTSFANASKDMMNTLLSALQTAGEIHSPSQLTKREIGPYLTEGVAEGMRDGIPAVGNAIYDIVSAIIGQFDDNIESISESASGISTAIQNGVNSSKEVLLTDIRNLGNQIVSLMRSILSTAKFKSIGSVMLTAIMSGINSKKKILTSTVQKVCENVMDTFKTGISESNLSELGSKCIEALNVGLSSNTDSSVEAARNVCSEIVKVFEDEMSVSKFNDIGQNAVNGLLNGSKDGEKEVDKATEKIASGAVNTAKQVLDINSPSGVFYAVGRFIDSGLANGIIDYIGMVRKASEKMSEESTGYISKAIYHINDVISSDSFNDEITITPIVDLSNVTKSTKEIERMFNSGIMKTSTNVVSASSSFTAMKSSGGSGKGFGSQNGNGSSTSNINFTQNNYSPKELSAIEIYRQTNNQLRFLKTQLAGRG